MTNAELQKLLQSFPQEAPIDVVADGGMITQALLRVELKIDEAPRTIEKNLAWADIVKDMIRVRLVYSESKPNPSSRFQPAQDPNEP
jgi:hypothetical protein